MLVVVVNQYLVYVVDVEDNPLARGVRSEDYFRVIVVVRVFDQLSSLKLVLEVQFSKKGEPVVEFVGSSSLF